jgi:hypothetical protein
MDTLIKTHDKVISLGYNCFIKKFIQDNGISQETHLFDWIGTSMWSINLLLESDFKDFLRSSEYHRIKTLETGDKIYTHKKYYLRFPHDFHTKKTKGHNWPWQPIPTPKESFSMHFPAFAESYNRRIKRFKEVIGSNQNLLFMRLEEDQTNRIVYPEYQRHFEKTEMDEMIKFSQLIRGMNLNLRFMIVLISKQYENSYDKENHILVLNNKYAVDKWENCTEDLTKVFADHKEYIESLF